MRRGRVALYQPENRYTAFSLQILFTMYFFAEENKHPTLGAFTPLTGGSKMLPGKSRGK